MTSPSFDSTLARIVEDFHLSDSARKAGQREIRRCAGPLERVASGTRERFWRLPRPRVRSWRPLSIPVCGFAESTTAGGHTRNAGLLGSCRATEVAQDPRARRAVVLGTSDRHWPEGVFVPGSSGSTRHLARHVGAACSTGGRKSSDQLASRRSIRSDAGARLAVSPASRRWHEKFAGSQIRPDSEYVLLTTAPVPPNLPSWVTRGTGATAGVEAFACGSRECHARRPRERAAGWDRIAIDVEIRPAGIVPAQWDGEGRAEWLTGEDPVLAISSGQIGRARDRHKRRRSLPSNGRTMTRTCSCALKT